LRSVTPPSSNSSSNRAARELNYGLKRADFDVISRQVAEGTLPAIVQMVPLRDSQQDVVKGEIKANANAIGTTPEFLTVANLSVSAGRFLAADDLANHRMVCVLGASAQQQLFGAQSSLGQEVRIGGKVFEVIGTMQGVGLAGGKGSALTGRDLNFDVYFPLTTNAALFSDTIAKQSNGTRERKVIQLSEIYLRAARPEDVEPAQAALQRLMDVRHAEQVDVKVDVPRELLNQANETQRTFNLVMGMIAALSLIVGGIGIMNISLATVTERTREIGIRRALGGKRRHIIVQFLVETTALSVSGGGFGMLSGIGLAVFVGTMWRDSFPTHVTLWSVLLSFAISAGVGIGFGVYPAIVAAHKDPIEALRHD